MALHGAIRGTVDVDLVIALHERAYVSAQKALLAIGMKPRLPVDAEQVFRFREEYITQRNLIAWSFYDPTRPERQVDIVITEDAKAMKATRMRIQGVETRVAALDALVAMKTKAGRPQDLEDVRALLEIKSRGKK